MGGLYDSQKSKPIFEESKKEELPGLDSLMDQPGGGKKGKKRKGGNGGNTGGQVLKTGFF